MEYILPSKEGLLASIKPDMRLTKDFFKKAYGYSITDVSFRDKVIVALETAGCSKARRYFEEWVSEYEVSHNAEMKRVAIWFGKECEKEWLGRQREGEEERSVRNLTKSELTELCQRLLQEEIITEPEQFAMAVGLDH